MTFEVYMQSAVLIPLNTCVRVCISVCLSLSVFTLADLGAARKRPQPSRPKFLRFQRKLEKQVGAPFREILDPPLVYVCVCANL